MELIQVHVGWTRYWTGPSGTGVRDLWVWLLDGVVNGKVTLVRDVYRISSTVRIEYDQDALVRICIYSGYRAVLFIISMANRVFPMIIEHCTRDCLLDLAASLLSGPDDQYTLASPCPGPE